MIKDALQGLTVGQQGQFMPQGINPMFLAQQSGMGQQVSLDPYGQQRGGLRAALMGALNGYRL